MSKSDTKRELRQRSRRAWIMTAAAVAASAAMSSTSLRTSAATDTWTGGGGDGNWNTAGNWDAGSGNAPPLANDILQFGGSTNLNTTNNYATSPSFTQFNGINFLAGAGSFTLGGNALILGGD